MPLAVAVASTALLASCGSSNKLPAGKTITITDPGGGKRTCIKSNIGGIYCPQAAPVTNTSTVPTITSPTGQKLKCKKLPSGTVYCPPAAATKFSVAPGPACTTEMVGVIHTGQKTVGHAKRTIPPAPGIDSVSIHGKDVAVTYRWAPAVWKSCRPLYLIIALSNRGNPYYRRVVTVPSKQSGVAHTQWLSTAPVRPDQAMVVGVIDKAGLEGKRALVRVRQG